MSVLSLLQDPRPRGGVATFVHWYREWMDVNRPQERDELYLDESSSTADYLRSRFRGRPEGASIPRLFPKLQVTQFPAARSFVVPAAQHSDEVHVIGAMALHGSMLGPTKTPYLVWLSTTVEEERAPQLPLLPFHRRAAFQYTLPLLQRVERSVLGGAAKVLVNSPYIATKIASMGVADTKISLLPVPIDTDVFTPGDAARTGALFVGRVHDLRKNYALLDRVVQGSVLLQTEGLNVVSSVAPPSRPGVTWLGDIPDLTQTYRAAKILVLPSLQEGFGIVAFEALSSGTPVVSMACGGPDEYLRESGGGRVVDRQEDFQGAIEEVLSDRSERDRMSAHGRRWVEEQLSARRFLADRSIFRI